jgi:hypothetical protein
LVIRTGSNEEGKLTFNENDIGKWHIGKSSDGSRLFFYSYDLQNTVMQLKNNDSAKKRPSDRYRKPFREC